eukprot:UN20920
MQLLLPIQNFKFGLGFFNMYSPTPQKTRFSSKPIFKLHSSNSVNLRASFARLSFQVNKTC